MARKKKPTELQQAIIDKANELNELFNQIPKTQDISMGILNTNQSIDFIIKRI